MTDDGQRLTTITQTPNITDNHISKPLIEHLQDLQ